MPHEPGAHSAFRAARGWSRSFALLRWVLVVCVAGALFAPRAHAQISPGPLAKAHASLDGPLNCTKCHGGGKESMTARCLSCHTEIATLIDQNRGFHARIPKAECASCHPDHAGRDFELVKWPDGSARQFDHARAGYELEGKHASLTCEKCHTTSLRVSPIARMGPQRTKAGWTGLDASCASCHQDVHKGTLARNCQSCHTTSGWSPAPEFDHARTRYPLTGKHVAVTCEQCHATTGTGSEAKLAVAAFRPLPHNDCVSCHRDPHGGRLTGRCSSCHVTTSFTSIGGKGFSHDRTRFPLQGRHAAVECVLCHTDYPRRIDRPAFATCTTCHIDYHHGQATIAGRAADCSSCHSVSGFTPSTFTVAQHARTAYPLVGRHAAIACTSCHVRRVDRKGTTIDIVMRPVANRCESCHASNTHGTELASRGTGAACVTCHTPAGWKPSTFGIREHATLRFALTGRHAMADCASCHSAGRKDLPLFPATRSFGTARVAFHLDETTCDACHRDPHGGKYVAAGRTPPQGSCFACHDTRAFHPSVIDAKAHARFAFALEGAHRAAPCSACHAAMATTSSLGASLRFAPTRARPVVYTVSGAGATCAVCHQSPHGNQFAARPDGGRCQSCHDLRGWSPASRFVHDADGGFTLGAAHERLACDRCHTVAAGRRADLRTWRGVPRACEACHTSGVRRP